MNGTRKIRDKGKKKKGYEKRKNKSERTFSLKEKLGVMGRARKKDQQIKGYKKQNGRKEEKK
jgi:hypothetical protein